MNVRCALTIVGLVMSMAPHLGAERLVEEHVWESSSGKGLAPVVESPAELSFITSDRGPAVEVTNGQRTAVTVRLVSFEQPSISTTRWVLTGEVEFAEVEGPAYLEMLSYLGDSGPFFTRTLAETGPMQKLQGSENWRAFALPFTSREDAPPPSRIDLNLVLPGPGRVTISPVLLVELAPGEDLLAVVGASGSAGGWWGVQAAGWIGGVLGSMIALSGAAIGVLGGQAKARGAVLGLLRGWLVIGLLGLGLGALALLLGQPYHVWYVPVLIGVICTILGLGLHQVMKRRYEQAEDRRLRAQEL